MCTVTYIPVGNHYFFTSSRDESLDRPVAEFPKVHDIEGQQILFPRDPQGLGSWIAVHESGHVAVLLNGALKPHPLTPPYRKSRGLVLLDLISKKSPVDSFEETDFENIEPFTVVLFVNGDLYTGKWDGQMRWLENLDRNQPKIWSSVTLYSAEAIVRRETWFREWLNTHPYPGTLDILRFHQKGGDGDPFNDILMKRGTGIFTNSISSVRLSSDAADFRYLDIRTGVMSEKNFSLKKDIAFQL